jgi:hypothetical protein
MTRKNDHQRRGPQGPLQGNAKRGLDAPYAEQEDSGAKELDSTLAGPKDQKPVSRDNTRLKNPDGDLDAPAADPRGR